MAVPSSAVVRAIAKKIKEEADLLYKTRPLLRVAKAKGGLVIEADIGTQLEIPVTTGTHSNITQFQGVGDQAYDLNVNEIGSIATFAWADASLPVLFTDREDRLNGGSETKRVETKLQRVAMTRASFERSFEEQLTAGTVARLSDWNTLDGGLGASAASADAFLHASTDQDNGGTVGGLSRDKTTLLANQAVSINGSTIQEELMRADNRVKIVSSTGRGVDLILMSADSLTALEQEGFTQSRFVDPKAIELGLYIQMWRGSEVAASNYLPSGVSTYGISFNDIKICMHASANFTFRNFERIPGTQKHAAYIDISGQLVSHGRLGESFVVTTGALIS